MRTGTPLRRPSTRPGFTLLEVLLTSLLAAVVLVALWSLSDIYMRLFLIAQRKIEETQLVRGLTEHLFEDLSQIIQKKDDAPGLPIIPRPISSDSRSAPREGSMQPSGAPPSPPPSSRGGPGSAGPPSVGTSTVGTSTSPSTATAEKSASDQMVPRFGLFGTSQSLRLIVLDTNPLTAREPSDLAEVLPQPGSVRPPLAAEIRTIEYTYVEPDGSTGDSQQHPPGLVRREWAWEKWVGLRMLNQNSSGSDSSSKMMPDGKLEWSVEDADDLEMERLYHVPSIVGLEFQYFNGEDWQDEWTSAELRHRMIVRQVRLLPAARTSLLRPVRGRPIAS